MTRCTCFCDPEGRSNYKDVISAQGWRGLGAQTFTMTEDRALAFAPPALHCSDSDLLAQATPIKAKLIQASATPPAPCQDATPPRAAYPGACVTTRDGNPVQQRGKISRRESPHADLTAETRDDSMKSHSPAPKVGKRFASLFLSDMHLGARSCRDIALLAFLQAHHAERIYLVGDIFDTWHGMGAHFNDTQHAIVQLLLARAAEGVEIIYTPGNHDAFFRQYLGMGFGSIKVMNHALHRAADGRLYLVIHGDSIDILVGRFPVLSRLAAKAENALRGAGNFAQHWLRHFDLPITRQVDWLVARVNDVIRAQDDFQARLIELARSHGADGIICGHFHQPALITQNGITYANCGDWVENASALAEDHAGALVQLSAVIATAPAPKRLPDTGLVRGA
jgi:UDP-2,3-diacylglucosamine pyrophosphatase LpxH